MSPWQVGLCLLVTAWSTLAFPYIEKRAAIEGGCLLDLNKDLPSKNEPIIFMRGPDKVLTLAMPETKGRKGSLNVREGQEVVVSCPGSKNSVFGSKDVQAKAVCMGGNTFSFYGKGVPFGQLDCDFKPKATVEPTKQRCAGGKGQIIDLGFKGEGWHTLVQSCHNYEDSSTFYSTHTIYGSNIDGKVIKGGRPGFSRGHKSLYKGFDPDDAYNQKNQKVVLSVALGQELASELLDYKKNLFLARGHLAPDADFLFASWQQLTYFFVNVAPQWQSINGGHWVSVETHSRKVASKLRADLDVATGTYGIMTLPDKKGKHHELYLAGKGRLPVPDLYWKVLRNPADSSCIAIISTNNPYIKEAPKTICPDICKNTGWPDLQGDLVKGYVYCCEYSTFKKAVPFAPDFTCKSLLNYPK